MGSGDQFRNCGLGGSFGHMYPGQMQPQGTVPFQQQGYPQQQITPTFVYQQTTHTFAASPTFGSSMPSFRASLSVTFGSSSPSFGTSSGQKPASGGFGCSPNQPNTFGSTLQYIQTPLGAPSSSLFVSSTSSFCASTSTYTSGFTTTPNFGASSFGSASFVPLSSSLNSPSVEAFTSTTIYFAMPPVIGSHPAPIPTLDNDVVLPTNAIANTKTKNSKGEEKEEFSETFQASSEENPTADNLEAKEERSEASAVMNGDVTEVVHITEAEEDADVLLADDDENQSFDETDENGEVDHLSEQTQRVVILDSSETAKQIIKEMEEGSSVSGFGSSRYFQHQMEGQLPRLPVDLGLLYLRKQEVTKFSWDPGIWCGEGGKLIVVKHLNNLDVGSQGNEGAHSFSNCVKSLPSEGRLQADFSAVVTENCMMGKVEWAVDILKEREVTKKTQFPFDPGGIHDERGRFGVGLLE